jgi:predicted ArsR family transcriptional regulator
VRLLVLVHIRDKILELIQDQFPTGANTASITRAAEEAGLAIHRNTVHHHLRSLENLHQLASEREYANGPTFWTLTTPAEAPQKPEEAASDTRRLCSRLVEIDDEIEALRSERAKILEFLA